MRLRWIWTLLVLLLLEGLDPSETTVPKEVLAEVESNLLSLFGIRKRPKVDRSKVVIPDAMLKLYEIQMGHPLDISNIHRPGLHAHNANTVRSFTHVESPIDARFKTHNKFRLYFDTKHIPHGELLQAAELLLTRDAAPESSPASSRQHVLVHDIIQPGRKGHREPIMRLIDSKSVDVRNNGTLSLDVLPAVKRWISNPEANHGILVVVKGGETNHLRLRRDLDEHHDEWISKQPLLFTYTDDGKNRRRSKKEMGELRPRRAAPRRGRRKDVREPCSRYSMQVDFAEVGWSDWIVAPPGYDAYYCTGECRFPMPDHMNTTNHAIVQTLVNSMNPAKVPRPCCVPTTLSSISMLYLDDNNKVVLKNYKEMVVVGCGCR